MVTTFSIYKYLSIVMLFSWPFQIAYFFLGDTYKWILLLSMFMAGIATFICGTYIFKEGFKDAGWSWGKPKHYLYVFVLALFLWFLPSIIERYFGFYSTNKDVEIGTVTITFLSNAVLTIVPAFGEEFSWRGYLLPRLLKKYNFRKALLVHGLVIWIWHLPFLIIMATKMEADFWTNSALVLGVSFVPTLLHAVVFAYIWARSLSLAVATAYHVFFDEIRDAIENTIGFGLLGVNWQMLALIILGALLLFKISWWKWRPISL